MPSRLPSLLAAPPVDHEPYLLVNCRLFTPGRPAPADNVTVHVADGRVQAVGTDGEIASDGLRTIDVAGRVVLPGLIDVHAHLNPLLPSPAPGSEPLFPGVAAHFLAGQLQDALRMGVTTMRDVGSYGDLVLQARQAMRYGAFRGPRVLTCGRIVSATAPGGKFFDGMYREADGPDEIRKAVREQIRRGADFIKIMSTGARSVELEDPDPAQVTSDEMTALVDEAHRLGYRVAAHSEGIDGTELAIRAGVDTIEHGMYLNQRRDLLDLMAANDQILVPTLSCFYGVAGLGHLVGVDDPAQPPTSLTTDNESWTPLLVDLAKYNLEQAELTLQEAVRAGVTIAAGFDWNPIGGLSIELLRMQHHGLTAEQTLTAATASAAAAAGLAEHVGTVEPGKIADLVVVDGDPLQDLSLLAHRNKVWLVVADGRPVAGTSLETTAG